MFKNYLYWIRIIGNCGVMVIIVENGIRDLSSNPGKVVCISFNAHTLRKGLYLTLQLWVNSRVY